MPSQNGKLKKKNIDIYLTPTKATQGWRECEATGMFIHC